MLFTGMELKYNFFIILTSLVSRSGFGFKIIAANTGIIVMVNSSLGEDADFSEKFVLRVLLISVATIYVVVALKVLDAFWPNKIVVSSKL